MASSPNSLLSTWKRACRGIRWPKTFASHCLDSVCALSVSVAVLTDTTEGAHSWGWHWRLLSIFSSRFRCLQAIYSYCFIFILFVVVVQFNNTSNFGHMLNLKKVEVVPNFILFFLRTFVTNILLYFILVILLKYTILFVVKWRHSVWMKHSYNHGASCRVLFR